MKLHEAVTSVDSRRQGSQPARSFHYRCVSHTHTHTPASPGPERWLGEAAAFSTALVSEGGVNASLHITAQATGWKGRSGVLVTTPRVSVTEALTLGSISQLVP